MNCASATAASQQSVALPASVLDGSAKLQQFLAILAKLRSLKDPLTSEAGLREGIEVALAIGSLVGIDDAWLARLRSVLDEPAVLAVVLAIVRYFSSLLDEPAAIVSTGDRIGGQIAVDADALVEWLPIVVDLIRLWRALRGAA